MALEQATPEELSRALIRYPWLAPETGDSAAVEAYKKRWLDVFARADRGVMNRDEWEPIVKALLDGVAS